MALLDSGRVPRDVLPPINHPDFEKSRHEKREPSRFSIMPGLSISTAPLASPNTLYSGPPPPYSCASSTTESAHGISGYFSPPQPLSRRPTWDEKNTNSAKTLPSLPSLHEALGGDKPLSFPGPPSVSQTHPPGATPTTAFPDASRGPPNPFTQSIPPPPIPPGHTHNETFLPKAAATRTSSLVSEAPLSSSQPYSSSPQVNSSSHRPSAASISSTTRPFETHSRNLSFLPEADIANPPYREYHPQSPPAQSHPSGSFHFEPTHKFDDSRNPFVRSHAPQSYDVTVKRHLDGFDAEMALNEIAETSSRTLDFSRSWLQRQHHANRTTCLAETAPSMQEIDEIIRQQSHVLQNLERIRQTVIAQQTQMSEQRARAARGHMEDEYHQMHDDYKNGGFAGGDAKKRRGKAAPPGRCHSCNRAETPEWRRGPDGARTLCNACGLHYAKLTRKLGANKAGALTGSNLRPKGLDSRPPHV